MGTPSTAPGGTEINSIGSDEIRDTVALSSVDAQRGYGVALIVLGVVTAGYFYAVLRGAIAPRGEVAAEPHSAGFVAAVGVLVAVAGVGHVAKLDGEAREELFLFAGGVLVLCYTTVLVGAPLSLSSDQRLYRYPPLYGTVLGLAAVGIAVYSRLSDGSLLP